MANRDKYKDDWIEAYKAANKKDAIMPNGEGWKRMCQLREYLQIGRDKTRMVVKQLLKEGRVDVFVGSEPDVTGALKKRIWYRIKK